MRTVTSPRSPVTCTKAPQSAAIVVLVIHGATADHPAGGEGTCTGAQ